MMCAGMGSQEGGREGHRIRLDDMQSGLGLPLCPWQPCTPVLLLCCGSIFARHLFACAYWLAAPCNLHKFGLHLETCPPATLPPRVLVPLCLAVARTSLSGWESTWNSWMGCRRGGPVQAGGCKPGWVGGCRQRVRCDLDA